MRRLLLIVAMTLAMAPLGVSGADLVVWWQKGFYTTEDEALADIIDTFEQSTGYEVELVQPTVDDIIDQAQAALDAGQPPDFLFSLFSTRRVFQWAYEDQLVDLNDALASSLNLFDADAIEGATLLNGRTGERGLYGLPMGRGSNHLHVWRSLLEEAGFTLDDIPKEWDDFWSFWCDEVQPAVRKATGRDDIWGIGMPMSVAGLDTHDQLTQFQLAYDAAWVDKGGRLQVEAPEVRDGMVTALDAYTAIWRKGCTPPDSVNWDNVDNNKAFLTQRVVMTANSSLSIPAALRVERPDDYYENAATIDWPNAANGQPLVIDGFVVRAVVFKAGGHGEVVNEFIRFLIEEGWLAHWLTFAGDRILPPMRKLIEQPFWLDVTDPHRLRATVQILSKPHQNSSNGVRDQEWKSGPIWQENVWGNAVHRVVTEGITPEQAVDEAIARIKEILSE